MINISSSKCLILICLAQTANITNHTQNNPQDISIPTYCQKLTPVKFLTVASIYNHFFFDLNENVIQHEYATTQSRRRKDPHLDFYHNLFIYIK
jgi:hypothetical protein